MGVESVGGGVIIAISALLWLVYLMPTWFRRRQYMATERNAVRLQQTLRILAETAEIPDEIRAEATARSVAEQHRALRQSAQKAESVSRSNDAAATRVLSKRASRRTAARATELREPSKRAAAVSAIASARLRRTRLMSTLVLSAAIVGAGIGVAEALNGSWILLASSVVVGFGALGMLQRIATVAAARRATQAVDRTITVSAPVQSFTDWQRSEPERPTWTPVPLPKPLYLSRRAETAGLDFAQVRAAAAAAAEADERLRAALAEPEVTQISTKRDQKTPAAKDSSDAASGFAAMGHLGETSPGITDLNDVLRRRRAV